MYKKLEQYAYNLLSHHSLKTDGEKYLLLISYVACIFAATMHFFLLLLHFYLGIIPLFIIDLFGFLLDIFLLRLVDKGNYLLFGILLSASVMMHTVMSAIHIGLNNLVIMYLLVTVIMQIMIPYSNVRIRALVFVSLLACMFALVYMHFRMTPVWDIGDANIILSLFNVNLAVFGTVIQLTVGNAIWSTILKFNRLELEKSKSEANTDPLTGLFNRRFSESFFKRLSTSGSNRIWCVAMLDIDDFKLINDTNGHQIGDEILVLISSIIRKNLRKTDIVIRWGGEEFLLLLKDVDVTTAFRILDKLRGKFESESLEVHGKIFNVTVTIGVCPLDNQNAEQSVDTCDRLMYKGKASGKNIVIM